MKHRWFALIVGFSFLIASVAVAQTTPTAADANARLARVVGVIPDSIVLHYYLVKNGGVIEITTKQPDDTATANAIMKYLESQKDLFDKGKNDSDNDVHGQMPAGLLTMKKLKNDITFNAVRQDNGGVLRIFSVNEQARQAIHDYMKYEIAAHATGDSPTTNQ